MIDNIFLVEIYFDLLDDDEICFISDKYSYECNGELIVELSPKQMAKCKDVDSLVELLKKKIYVDVFSNKLLSEDSYFIDDVRNLESMDEIIAIRLVATKIYPGRGIWKREYIYNIEEDKYSLVVSGECMATTGSSGKLKISDAPIGYTEDESCEWIGVAESDECDNDYDDERGYGYECDEEIEEYFKSLIVNNPETIDEISQNCNTVYRLFVIARDNKTMEIIKKQIKEMVTRGEEIIEKATYVAEKNMFYFIASDFFDDSYDGDIEELIRELRLCVKGKFIILCDKFEIVPYDENDYSEEGTAECSFGDKWKHVGWDCCEFDLEMDKNMDLNITNILDFMEMYGFGIKSNEADLLRKFIKE